MPGSMVRMATAGALMAYALSFPPSLLPASAKTIQVVIDDLAFGKVPMDARVGDAIDWSNQDFVAHTATARDGSFDVILAPGKSGRTVLKHAGEIAFYCRFHPTMTGEIAVAP